MLRSVVQRSSGVLQGARQSKESVKLIETYCDVGAGSVSDRDLEKVSVAPANQAAGLPIRGCASCAAALLAGCTPLAPTAVWTAGTPLSSRIPGLQEA